MEEIELGSEKDMENRARVSKNMRKMLYVFIICSFIALPMIYLLATNYADEFKGGDFTNPYWILMFTAFGMLVIPVIIITFYNTYHMIKLNLIPIYKELFRQYRK